MPSYTEYYAVWIDWDQNEIFATSENWVVLTSLFQQVVRAPLRLQFRLQQCQELPVCAFVACTALRELSVPATTYSYGEVEDYSVFIPNPTDYNVGVTDMNMETACGLGMENITVTVTNIGEESVSDFDIESYYYDDPVSGLSGTVTGNLRRSPIPSFGSVDYTFYYPGRPSKCGRLYTLHFTSMDLDTGSG